MDMIQQHVIPAVAAAKAAGVPSHVHLQHLQDSVATLTRALTDLHHTEDLAARAEKARVLRLETMGSVREHVDAAEAVVPANLWTLATYKDLLFLDHTMP